MRRDLETAYDEDGPFIPVMQRGLEGFMSKEREYHDDGSYTDRFSDGQSVTHGPDGTVREHTRDESNIPIPFAKDILGPNVRVTRDGDGNVTKAERKK